MDARDPLLPAACRAIAADLFELVADSEAPGLHTDLEQHLATCEPCVARLRRARLNVEALGRLQRVDAPLDLDGRVVAALQAGHRQVRAADALTQLPRQEVPEELNRGDWIQPGEVDYSNANNWPERRPVPSVLDRLVDESLQDLQGSVSSGLLGRLRRRRAPEALDMRVDAMLASGAHLKAGRRGALSRVGGGSLQRALFVLPAGIAAAAVLFVLARPMLGSLGGSSSTPTDDYPFEVVRRDAFDSSQHSALTLDLFESLTGHPVLRPL